MRKPSVWMVPTCPLNIMSFGACRTLALRSPCIASRREAACLSSRGWGPLAFCRGSASPDRGGRASLEIPTRSRKSSETVTIRTSSATWTSCSWRRADSRWATRSWTAGVWLTTRLMVSGKYWTAPHPPLACQVAGSTVPTRRRTRRSSSVAGSFCLASAGQEGTWKPWMGTTRSATGYVRTVILSRGGPARAGAANTTREAAIRAAVRRKRTVILCPPVGLGGGARDQPARRPR